MSWVFEPFWSTRLILGVLLALLFLTALRRWRERAQKGPEVLLSRQTWSSPAFYSVLLRLGVIGLLGWVMLNPQSLLPREQKQKPRLTVLLDSSASMATGDAGTNSRWAAALLTLTNSATLQHLQGQFVLDFRLFDETLRPADLSALGKTQPLGEGSDIGPALMQAVSEQGQTTAQAGILLVSDGHCTSGRPEEAAQLALARSVPLWTWTLGGPVSRHDLWIETASSEALAFSGTETELAATLHQAGYPHRSFKVELWKDSRLEQTQEVLPDPNGIGRVLFRVTAPAMGEERYLLRVPPEPEEAETANNERAVFVRAVGGKAHVLVAEGQPHWDTKFLVQALKRNPNVTVTAVYHLNATRNVAVVSTAENEAHFDQDLFPRSQQEMNSYDIILLGRGAEGFFDAQTETLLADYVSQRGGSLVFTRGKAYGGRFQPLAKLEPLAWGSGQTPAAHFKPTEAGRESPLFDLGASGTLAELLERLPALDQVSVTLGEKPLAVVLASAGEDGPAMVAYQRYGQGKVLTLNATGLWHWAFRENAQDESEVAYGRFWLSLLQWLLAGNQFLPGADVALSSSHRYYSSTQPLQFLIATRNLDAAAYKPQLRIQGNHQDLQLEPRPRGEYFVAEAGPFAPGNYRITLQNNIGRPAEVRQQVEVISASIEKQDLSAAPELMQSLARISGGAVVSAQDIVRLPELFHRWEAQRQIAHRQQPLWDRPWLLAALLGLLGLEWYLRRREGLL